MRLTHLRNATMVIEAAGRRILVDPMLGSRGTIPPFTFFRFPPKKNPLVDLPENSQQALENIDACLITHSRALGLRPLQHFDHLDRAGERYLRERSIPVVCPQKDTSYLQKLGLEVMAGLEAWTETDFLEGHVTAVPAIHGYGWIHKIMANGVGFFLRFPNEPSLYISGDTIYTEDVERALRELRPDISVVAAGAAQLDIGRPLLMTPKDVQSFIQAAPGRVVANHLEALNHCPIRREELRQVLKQEGWSDRVAVPEDGDVLEFEA